MIMSFDKVCYEGDDIPFQQVAQQCSCAEATCSHALLVENNLQEEDSCLDSATPDNQLCTLFIMSTSGKTRKNPCESGTVHNQKLENSQGKFLIHKVLDTWDSYDADIYCPILCGS